MLAAGDLRVLLERGRWEHVWVVSIGKLRICFLGFVSTRTRWVAKEMAAPRRVLECSL